MKVIFIKKIIFALIAVVILIILGQKESLVIIPTDAIRIRIISNSNNMDDLMVKSKIKNNLENYLYDLLKDSKDTENARNIIKDNMDNINRIIKNDTSKYSINYGMNYFPKKTYRGILYPEGEYESLEIKIGSGIGSNYWCVLFPPLCMIDENKITDDVSYQLYIKNILNGQL